MLSKYSVSETPTFPHQYTALWPNYLIWPEQMPAQSIAYFEAPLTLSPPFHMARFQGHRQGSTLLNVKATVLTSTLNDLHFFCCPIYVDSNIEILVDRNI